MQARDTEHVRSNVLDTRSRSRDESKSVPPRVVRAERGEKERMRGSKRRCEVNARARGEWAK